MATSQEVFALRKAGSLDEAYALAIEIIEDNPNDEWNIKALAWCLYDLTKRAVSLNNYPLAKTFVERIEGLQISELDEILLKSVEHAKVLANPEKRIILQAKEKSKQGNHQEALVLFRQAIQQFPDDIDLNTQFAWELQKEGKVIFDADKVDIQKARQLLADYIKLKNDRPSQLHSFFLRFADKITDREEFNLISFLKLWDLENLREDDFEPFKKEDKVYKSIAEKIIQHGAKLILDKKLIQDVEYFLPSLDIGIVRCQDNIWLPYYKAKLLHLVNRNEEAIEFLIPVVKEKISDYWTWSLLAELVIEADKEKAISCYCKSLLCKGEDKFIANVRTKFAELLIQKELWSEAKFEIASAIKAKEAEEGGKASDRLRYCQNSDWYKNAVEKKSNFDFYNSHKQLAEEFIFHSLSWIDGCLGGTFTIPDKPDKPRRIFFIKLNGKIIEIVISDKKFNTSRNYREGDSIRIKGEYDKEKLFQIFLLEKRSSQSNWDLFEWQSGNVVQVIKNEAGKITALRISTVVGEQMKEGIIYMKDINANFPIKEGVPIFVKLYREEKESASEKNRNILLPKGLALMQIDALCHKNEKTHSMFSFSSEKEQRVHILSISERANGKPWDTFPENIGIVDHINKEKGIAHFIVSKNIDSIIKLNQLNEAIEIGSKILVKLKKVTNERDSYFTVLNCCLTQQEPTEKILRTFSGMVNLSGSVGFADDVYIESSLIFEYRIEDGHFIDGVAVINYNKKKEKWGWKAIKILRYDAVYED